MSDLAEDCREFARATGAFGLTASGSTRARVSQGGSDSLGSVMINGVQLITYADRFGGGDLSTIRDLLNGPLQGAFTGVHVLPFYTPFDGADAGFDPIDHRVVDPRLGTWEDIRQLAATHDVMADLIVNHISDESPQFRDFLSHGDESPYAGMFLERETVFPDGPSPEELAAVYRPRPGDPFTTVSMADGSERTMWTTFTPSQIDLDLRTVQAAEYIDEVLDRMVAAGVNQVRLDAVGYAIKTPGTSCFMTEDTHDFILDVCAEVNERGMVSLLEIHSHHLDQVEAAGRVDRVYDFALPPLVLYALYSGSAVPLKQWLEIAPRNTYTVLDTHDGIGIVDVGPDGDRDGILSPSQLDELVEAIHAATGGESRQATGYAASNVDLYQVNSTFYSALSCDDDRYLLARLIQFLAPGIPQVYYAGLLAARNDVGLLEETGVGRDINRPHFTGKRFLEASQLPVVIQLLDLCRFRNTHPAFGGSFSMIPAPDHILRIRWDNGDDSIEVTADLASARFEMRSVRADSEQVMTRFSDFSGA